MPTLCQMDLFLTMHGLEDSLVSTRVDSLVSTRVVSTRVVSTEYIFWAHVSNLIVTIAMTHVQAAWACKSNQML